MFYLLVIAVNIILYIVINILFLSHVERKLEDPQRTEGKGRKNSKSEVSRYI